MKSKWRNLAFFIGVMIFTISLELALDYLGVKEENIYLVFVLSILITIIETKNIYYGLSGSVISVLSFNFFITEPRFTFVVDDTNNYVSFVMFIVVTYLVNSLVIQLQKQIEISHSNEKKIQSLYRFSTDFLHAQSMSEIYSKAVDDLREYLNSDVSIVSQRGEVYGRDVQTDDMAEAIEFCQKTNRPITSERGRYAWLPYCFFPICSAISQYGAVVIDRNEGLGLDEIQFVENVVEEMVVVLDKNFIATEQEETKIQVENEKFKTSLLRGLSHDIRTPLTVIQSGSGFLSDSFSEVDDETKRELIRDIYNESCDLSEFVENLLDMTRLDNEHVRLNRTSEAVEDILYGVCEKLARRLKGRSLTIVHPEEKLYVNADISLLTQVLMNLADNAVKHTPDGTWIRIRYEQQTDGLRFMVEDNGGGIAEEKLPRIFDNFYTISADEDRKRNHGLGLSICRSIVEAHGGRITAYNNEEGGVTFAFTIPNEESSHEGKDTGN